MENIQSTQAKLKTANAVIENDRKLARIVKIDQVIKHPNADSLSLAMIGGWQCVIRLDEYKAGDLAIYCEIDSLLPVNHPSFKFLESRNSDNRLVGEDIFHKLKSIKLRKELSQGLLVPIPDKYKHLPIDSNVTNELGILKYESPNQVAISDRNNEVKGTGILSKIITKLLSGVGGSLIPWPVMLTKSDQDRVQNRTPFIIQAQKDQDVHEVTYKLDGSSMTVFCVNERGIRTGVCSRNYELALGGQEVGFTTKVKYWLGTLLMKNRRFFKTWEFRKPTWLNVTEGTQNNFTEYVVKHKVIDALKKYHQDTGRFITVQGELIGPSIQNGFEGVTENEYHIFSVYENGNLELLPQDAQKVVKELGLNYVPIFDDNFIIPKDWTVKDILEMAEGDRAFNKKKGTYREGLVFKSKTRRFSFKAISNSYLLKSTD